MIEQNLILVILRFDEEIPLIRKTSIGAVQYLRQAKIALFWPTHHTSSRMIKRSPFYNLYLFLEAEKKTKIRTIHDTSIHVFKQLNQIVRFK